LGKQTLTQQTALLFFGNALALVFGLAIPVILVRVFPKEEYGLYQQIFLIFMTLLPFGQMGVTQGLYYFLPREPDKKDAIVVQTFIFVIAAGALCFFLLVGFRSILSSMMNSPGKNQQCTQNSDYLARQ
jgi:O-antigen/teichoic acid export membrane protein